ncbi:hypothetical protein KP2612_002063 [Komagataella phaffii]|uniref:Histone-lysine N-methyltransferase, H3 lysine-4 specific n=1 Tax=Komagataella phaffii (strain GS115 / ATCC 20864) TaxID=644223 RepID=C4R217_KOMPG|nr:uncharacterized protein PAS_chr2-2_0494 [Komagataella phaffii GS115]AOA63040.1 GQ67_00961T0 [Komagataella phaffii]AOA67338.1 GQ68_00428T0 [Komagataella phaffii GS115]CAH2447914.1 Hypothetical protein BQ9382_C2-2110 [Komagataella phaffii CBS 7435]CAY69541.1 hypothetical protein PAS_chr2-2_0494 [Komagataella phaffii GS115]
MSYNRSYHDGYGRERTSNMRPSYNEYSDWDDFSWEKEDPHSRRYGSRPSSYIYNNPRPNADRPNGSIRNHVNRTARAPRNSTQGLKFQPIPEKYQNISYNVDMFPRQLHHVDEFRKFTNSIVSTQRNFRIVYDPEVKKDKRKGNAILIKKQEESDPKVLIDPRKELSSYPHIQRSDGTKSAKRMFRSLLPTKHTYDSASVGPPPTIEIIIHGLSPSTAQTVLKNNYKRYGPIADCRAVVDPVTAVPLGLFVLSFSGKIDEAHTSCLKALNAAKDGVRVNGGVPRTTLFSESRLNEIKHKIIKQNENKRQAEVSEQQRLEQERKLQDQRRLQYEKEQELKRQRGSLRIKKQEEDQQRIISKQLLNNTELSNIFHSAMKDESHNQTLYTRNGNNGRHHRLSKVVDDAIRKRPYLFISAKFIPVRDVPAREIMNLLRNYPWKRVLTDAEGFYVVFDSIKEAEKCLENEDGRKFYQRRLYMDLVIHPDFMEDKTELGVEQSISDQSTSIISSELERYLIKDIKDKIIAPTILEMLRAENFSVEIESALKKKKDLEEKVSEPYTTATTVSPVTDSFTSFKLPTLPSFRKSNISKKESSSRKKQKLGTRKRYHALPMTHVLNFDSEGETDEHDSGPETPNGVLMSMGPNRLLSERKQSFISDSSTSEDESEVERDSEITTPEKHLGEKSNEQELALETSDDKAELKNNWIMYDPKYRPTTFIRPVGELYDAKTIDIPRLKKLIEDDEDLKLAQKLFSDINPDHSIPCVAYWIWNNLRAFTESSNLPNSLGPMYSNQSGSFKSEGYTKIPDTEKSEYLPHRRKIHKPLNTVENDDEAANPNPKLQSSRVNRANNRRFAADINAQKQMLNSETDILDLNHLTKRKKPVSFARSAIHNWGLYALEPIAAKEMIIEYVGEILRQKVSEVREKKYLKSGIGSSYLFRVDEDTVIDATKKGGIARFINHCCQPSCTAKIIKVEGKKRIVIYALKDIAANEELTYDYKFEREDNNEERIPCLCGVPGCKGYLN